MNSFGELYSDFYGDFYDEFETISSTYHKPFIQNCNVNEYILYESLKNIDRRYLGTASISKYSFNELNDAENYVMNNCRNGSIDFYAPLDNSYRVYMDGERCKFLLINRMNAWHVIRLYTAYWSISRIEETFK